MSVNTAHANGGVLLHAGESILLYVHTANVEFFTCPCVLFRRRKTGSLYLTSHRLIFISKVRSEPLQSFSAPFIAINELQLLPDNNGRHFIRIQCRAQPNGNFVGRIEIKIFGFLAIDEFAQATVTAGSLALQNVCGVCETPTELPPYAPTRAWYDAPLAAYSLPKGYFDWLPMNFPDPLPNLVFLSDNPPPFPGIQIPSIKGVRGVPCMPFTTLEGVNVDFDEVPISFVKLRDSRGLVKELFCRQYSDEDVQINKHKQNSESRTRIHHKYELSEKEKSSSLILKTYSSIDVSSMIRHNFALLASPRERLSVDWMPKMLSPEQ